MVDFANRQPYGEIKGRGVKNLLKQIEEMVSKEVVTADDNHTKRIRND